MAVTFEIAPHNTNPDASVVLIKVDGDVCAVCYTDGDDSVKVVSAHFQDVVADPDLLGDFLFEVDGGTWPPIPALHFSLQPSPYVITPSGIERLAEEAARRPPVTEEDFSQLELFAFVGEDEFGSGEVGLKQGVVPAGTIPLVAIQRHKLDRPSLLDQLQRQVDGSGKPIRLVRLQYSETLRVIEPTSPEQ